MTPPTIKRRKAKAIVYKRNACPYCDGDLATLEEDHQRLYFRTCCTRCGLSGPEGATEAIAEREFGRIRISLIPAPAGKGGGT